MYRRRLTHVLTLALIALAAGIASMPPAATPGRWMAGDFHQHSYLTDGSFPTDMVLVKGFEYGLAWAANSEHGGAGYRDSKGNVWSDKSVYPVSPILGDEKIVERETEQDGETVKKSFHLMWRWQSLTEFAYKVIQRVRRENPENLAATGLEWNVPGHEHCSVGIVAEDAMPIGEFEYRFDRGDDDTSGGPGGIWKGKQFNQREHAKSVEAVKWMQENHPKTGWIVFAHPERVSSFTVADFRDFNNAGPDVAFGFEGLPGHQRSSRRGGYRDRAVGGGTYGGAGYYIAEVGGTWDALLGEGRNWWTFVSSDFHSLGGDFWPGQYAKTWTWVADGDGDGEYTLADIPGALRSGNSFCVHGDLIDRLDFHAESQGKTATMGESIAAKKGKAVDVVVRFRSPEKNDNGDAPRVRTLQVITGDVSGKVEKFLDDGETLNPEYSNERNATTKIAAVFTEPEIRAVGDGWYETPPFRIKKVKKDMYVRVRGSNLLPSTQNETDAKGNPLADSLVEQNTEWDTTTAAWKDLWFYSNPVFVDVR